MPVADRQETSRAGPPAQAAPGGGWKRRLPPALMGRARRLKARALRWRLMRQLAAEMRDDLMRYWRYSHDGRADRLPGQREGALLKQYHGVEKGLSIRDAQAGRGQDKVRALLSRLEGRDPADPIAAAALDSVRDWRAFNRAGGVDLPWLDAWFARHAPEALDERAADAPSDGGTVTRSRAEIRAATDPVGPAFFETRHSLRNFGPGEVPVSEIARAVAMARKSPSVCNRQGARVHCFTDPMQALQWQPGNAGFGHLASKALVVTADLQAFSSVGERNQAYIDGGLFAMSLVYALHSLGHGSCMLAWSQEKARSRAARRALGIPDHETILMMIAVGEVPETLSVARAWRRPVDQILRVV